MRFLCVYKATEGVPPSQQHMEDMGKLIDEMTAAGVLLGTEGYLPSAIEWTKRFIDVAGDGESEIRQLYEAPS